MSESVGWTEGIAEEEEEEEEGEEFNFNFNINLKYVSASESNHSTAGLFNEKKKRR